MHVWCAEKENRGKGGSRKGKIGAGVGSYLWIQSGSRRDPVGTQSRTNSVRIQSGSSRDPVGIQSGSSRAPMSGGSQIHKKKAFLQCFCAFLGDFGYFPTDPNFQKNAYFLNLSTYF